MHIRASPVVLRTSRPFNVVAPSGRTLCQSLPPSNTSPESLFPLERATRHDANPTICTRRGANNLQPSDIQAHHEQRLGSERPENLGHVVVEIGGHDCSIGFVVQSVWARIAVATHPSRATAVR